MPLSTGDGRKWVTDRMADSNVSTVIDVGAGQGTYSILGRHLIWSARWIAVEIHEPYVDRFLLGQQYDDVVVSDIRDWKPEIDDYLILFGDVLEHMPRQDAIDLLEFHKQQASEIMVSLPIIYAPQGACFGNEHEAHLHHWHWNEMLEVLGDCEGFQGVEVGRFWWRKDPAE